MFDTYAEIFAQRAAEYHYAMRSWPRARDAEFRCVIEPLGGAPGGLVCDMPSGGGYLADYLHPGMSYIAVDPASGFFVEWEKPLQRLTAEITSVPLADRSVDHVVSLAGLHHEPDLPAVFREMRRLVRPGGRVVLADVAAATPPAEFLNGFVARNNPMGHDGHFLDAGAAALLEDAGLVVVADEMVDVPWQFDDRRAAGEFCRNLFGMTALDADAVAIAMGEEIGFDEGDGGVRLKWTLRRQVCEPR
jgi:SAM-dependent methyltransferase